MSYCLVRSMMIAHVQDGQLVCSKYKIKLGGKDSTTLFNFMHRVFFEFNGHVLLENEGERDIMPTLHYRKMAKVLEGNGSVFSRIVQLALKHGVNCRLVNCFKDADVGFMFYLSQPSAVACQILETDREELWGKTLLVGADKDVDYVGRNVVPVFCDDNYDVDDKVLGINMFSLYDDSSKLMVMVGK